jgi:Uma2 family endonuclease
VSPRGTDWEHDYRCPDVVVVLPGGAARDAGTHWQGGPDLVVEVVSPNDRSREKLAFYEALGVREVLLVDRDSKALEVHALQRGHFALAGACSAGSAQPVTLSMLGLTLAVRDGPPQLAVTHPASGRHWKV